MSPGALRAICIVGGIVVNIASAVVYVFTKDAAFALGIAVPATGLFAYGLKAPGHDEGV